MRTIFFITTLLFSTLCSFAEPTFLHRFGEDYGYFNVFTKFDYETNTSNYYSESAYSEFYPSNCLYYFWKEDFRDKPAGTYTMHFYDENFSEISTFIFDIPSIKGYNIYSFSIYDVTRHIFNDDDEYEYIVQYRWNDSLKTALRNGGNYNKIVNNQEYRLVVFKQDGSIFYDFGTSSSSFSSISSLHKVGDKFRLYLNRYLYAEDGSTARYYDIYQVDKSSTTGLNIVERTPNAYPNPAVTEINLPVENGKDIRIFDMCGRVIEVCPTSENSMYQLNVSNYPSGTYLYESGGKAKQFIVR